MKTRGFITMALAFIAQAQMMAQRQGLTLSTTEALADSPFKGVNLGESPMYFPTKSQQIKSKRLAKRNGR